MTLVADTADTEVQAESGDSTLLTAGDPHEPDQGAGEKQPDKGDGEKQPDKAEADEEAEEAATGAPEEYGDFTVAEGVVLDAAILDDFKAAAKELDLSQDKAQKLVDLGVKMRQADAEAIVAIREEWVGQSKADTEFGGDKLDESLATAKRALDAFGSPALVEFLNSTGAGNHPEIIRLLVNAGKTVSEDSFVKGGKAPPGARDLASRLYGPKE